MDDETNKRKKRECPICHRLLRTRCFIYNSIKKVLVCKSCHRKIGTNKWYIPKEQRYGFHNQQSYNTKYNLSSNEKNAQHRQLVRMGYTDEEAWKRINSTQKYLKLSKWKRKKEYWNMINQRKKELKEGTQKKKQFIQGLKNG